MLRGPSTRRLSGWKSPPIAHRAPSSSTPARFLSPSARPWSDLGDTDKLGWGVAIWFGCDDADALHDHLVEQATPIVFTPKDGPFGRYFAFRDPFGYTITPHTVAQP